MIERRHKIADLAQQLRETIILAKEAFALFGPDSPYGVRLCEEAAEISERLCAA